MVQLVWALLLHTTTHGLVVVVVVQQTINVARLAATATATLYLCGSAGTTHGFKLARTTAVPGEAMLDGVYTQCRQGGLHWPALFECAVSDFDWHWQVEVWLPQDWANKVWLLQ